MIDFAVVEKLRERCLLRATDMATLFGVSQPTYFNWVKGKSIREKNHEHVAHVLSQLVFLVREKGWPPNDVKGLTAKQRWARLQELLASNSEKKDDESAT